MNLKEKLKKTKTSGKSNKTLLQNIYDAGTIPNIATGFTTVLYVLITTRISTGMLVPIAVIGVITCILLQFIVAPITNKLIVQSLSDEMDNFYRVETTEQERTKLLKQLMSMPEKIGLEVFVVFLVGSLAYVSVCRTFFTLDTETVIMFVCAIVFGAYTGLVLGVVQTQKVCSKYGCDVVAKGVLKDEVKEKHSFGISSTRITVIHIFAPLLFINLMFMVIAWRSFTAYLSAELILIRMSVICVVNLIFYSFLSTLLFKRMMTSINSMKTIMAAMNKENLHMVHSAPTDLSNEFMYNVHLINTIIELLQSILKASSEISMEAVESSNELSVISKETAVTSLEQSSGTKELLTAMEESDSLARNISEKIGEVSLVAKRTTQDINEGFEILKQNMQKISEIKRANEITVDGIKALTEKISGISDIAGIINSIADQTNIIAFNAELEASSAGEAGDNFHNVANEIRRLTNKTIQSTNEIRNKIIEIQHSSENLLASSRNGSNKISDGNEIINELHTSFTNLKISSESADKSSEEIKKIIEQQTASFEQIVITLRQIAEATENFSVSTQKISQSAENLCVVSDQLKLLQPKSAEDAAEVESEKGVN